jgi:hypothetical protein
MSRSADGQQSDRSRPRAYLAGAMELAPDRGRAWRERLLPVLEELGHDWFNPCEEELAVSTEEERARFREWKASGHERFIPLMQRIIDYDLAALEGSDYVVCYWDEHAQRSGGTSSEVTLARVWGKPVFLVRALARADISSWVQGCATATFATLDELCDYLRQEFRSP